MRLLVLSDPIWLQPASGYSKIAEKLCLLFNKDGHTVGHIPIDRGIRGTSMLKGHAMTWKNTLLLEGGGVGDIMSESASLVHYYDFKADFLLTIKDIWNFRWLKDYPINWIPVIPIDHKPVSREVTARIKTTFQNITITRFGKRELMKAGIPSTYVPLFVDTELYKPIEEMTKKRKKELGAKNKGEAKETFGLPPDCFAILIMKMNRRRGMIPRMYRACKRFLENNPDAAKNTRIISWNRAVPEFFTADGARGTILSTVVRKLELDPYIFFPSDKLYMTGLEEWRMPLIYNASNCILCASAEGFWLPGIEAGACVPYDTIVNSPLISIAWERGYQDELIEIETGRGYRLTLTPEHPLLTSLGWKLAKHLTCADTLYSSGVWEDDKTTSNKALVQGRIGEITESIFQKSKDDEGRTRQILSEQNAKRGRVGNIPIGSAKNNGSARYSKNMQPKECEISVYRGANRCRWNNYHTKDQQGKAHSPSCNLQQQQRGHRVGCENGEITRFLLARARREQTRTSQSLRMVHERNVKHQTILGTNTTLLNNQEKTSKLCIAMGRKRYEKPSILGVRLLGLRAGITSLDKMVEPEAIAKIRRRQTSFIKVYNLTTKGNLYFANGLLVHNCGVPAVVVEHAAAPEVTTGELARVADWDVMNPIGYDQPLVDIDDMAEGIQKIYNGDPERYAKEAREYSLKYDVITVYEKYWRPFLRRIQPMLRPLVKKGGIESWTLA